jgi:catechol 2,3-dioxygenase-like lactoylglutathione lyase family enzyme
MSGGAVIARATPRLSHILETSLYVSDLDVSREFYQRVLGGEVFLQDARMCALGVAGGGVLLLFIRGGSAEPSETPNGTIPSHDGQGVLHLAFAIPRCELDAWEAHLAAEDITIESRITWPRGGTSLYFRDPDGHSVEVATPGLWPNF